MIHKGLDNEGVKWNLIDRQSICTMKRMRGFFYCKNLNCAAQLMSVKFCHSVVASSGPIVCSIFQKVCTKNAQFYQSGKTKCPLLVTPPPIRPMLHQLKYSVGPILCWKVSQIWTILAVWLHLALDFPRPQVSTAHHGGSKAGGWGVEGSGHHHSGPAAHITTGRRAHALEHTGWWCLFCVCVRQSLAMMDELMERLVYPVRATGGDRHTYRHTDRQTRGCIVLFPVPSGGFYSSLQHLSAP